MSKPSESPLYPAIEPYNIGSLKVSDLHTIVYEEVGNPDGRPALFLHGGPGVGITPAYRQFFDPDYYRIILVDQRGAGRSTPHAEIAENTTAHIVADLEQIRLELGIHDWIVMGGSWGSLLALVYAIRHPRSVAGIIIRGIFLGRPDEIEWLHGPYGAARVYPDEWERYQSLVPDGADGVETYCELLKDPDEETRLAAARAWSRWEFSMVNVFPDPEGLEKLLTDPAAVSTAHIESYYTLNNFFMESDNHVLDNAAVIGHIPTRIIHGRYDTICPPISAWELHKALPNSRLTLVPDGAHSPLDGGMTKELVAAADEFRDLGL